MMDYETFCKIRKMSEQDKLKSSQIAKEMCLDQRTVARWIQEDYRPRKSTVGVSILTPFKDEINRILEKHPYTATQVFQQLQELDYEGSYSTVKKYVQKIRPKRSPAFLKLAFAPGECAQVDWGSFGSVNVGNTRRRLSFFVMVLCYSRLMYVEFTVSQTMEHWLSCHQHAFEFFGAVPARIMVDNLKSAVLRRIIGQAPVFNQKYLDFSSHYGFSISACNVGKGNEKGIVERGVGYIKKNLLKGLDIQDFSHLNPACKTWLDTIANVRIHGETRKSPTELFDKERAHLQNLPANPYDIATISQVRASSQFRVSLDTNRYSVPAEYAGVRLTMKTYPDRLCFYYEEKLLARHTRCYDRHQDFENPDHPKPLLAKRRKAKTQMIYKRFLALSPRAEEYHEALAAKRFNPVGHVRKIVGLSEIYGSEDVKRAMDDAFLFQAFSSEYIANILEQRNREVKKPGVLHLTRSQDLLNLEVELPDMSVYKAQGGGS
ncbi:MAG: IS21 family transposase [Deltaproteobacteria bacterium]|nr:IS21 family transposase [Deltaproteobacteria bacterium]